MVLDTYQKVKYLTLNHSLMPLTTKGKKILKEMKKEYGKDAENVFYASKNKGIIKGVEKKPNKKK